MRLQVWLASQSVHCNFSAVIQTDSTSVHTLDRCHNFILTDGCILNLHFVCLTFEYYPSGRCVVNL